MVTGTGNYLMVTTTTKGSLKKHARGENPRRKQPKAAAKRGPSKPAPMALQRLEGLFRECTHPDMQVRSALAKELGLTSRQVKDWFQNHRKKLKVIKQKEDRIMLLEEKNMLLMENSYLKASSCNHLRTSCPSVPQRLSPDAQQLQTENASLREELDRLRGLLNSMEFLPESSPVLSSWNSFAGNTNGYHQGELLNNHWESSGPRGLMNSVELMPDNPSATSGLGSVSGSTICHQGDEPLNNHWESSGPRGSVNPMEFVRETWSDTSTSWFFAGYGIYHQGSPSAGLLEDLFSVSSVNNLQWD